MKRASAVLRPGLLAAGALVGLLGAHALDYWLLIADPARRAEVLSSTGHAWLPAIESMAVACAIASVVGAAWSHFGSRHAPGHGWRAVAFRIAAAQSVAFVALELGERAFAGAPLHHLTPLLLAAGLALQAVTAAAVAGALTLLGRAGSAISRALRAAPRRPRRAPRPLLRPRTRATVPPHPALAAADPVRGPPVPAVA